MFASKPTPSRRLGLVLTTLLACAVVAPACSSTPTIPGTDIPDTPESRAILDTLERYRVAFVERDPAGVLATADRSYADHGGTDDPSDDIVYDDLPPLLKRRLGQLEAVRFAMDYVEVHVSGDRAVARVWVDASFRLRPLLDQVGTPRAQPPAQLKQDFAEFELLRQEDDTWLITRGF